MYPAEEVEEIKQSLDNLTSEISTVKLQQTEILKLVAEVKELRLRQEEKDKRIAFLERRVNDLEQYTRVNDVIISGLSIKPRSYARAVTSTNRGEPDEQDVSSTEQQVAAFLSTKEIELDINQIDACYPLPRSRNTDKPAVILKLLSRKQKKMPC